MTAGALEGPHFVLFGGAHLLSLALIALVCAWIAWLSHRADSRWLALAIALLLLVQELLKQSLHHIVLQQPWTEGLPLNLCRINEFLCAFMLVRRSYGAFEVAYFWAMGGSLVALLTPDLAAGLPDPRFVSFFVGHGLVVVAVVYGLSVYGFRLRLRSLAVALAVSAVYAAVVAGINGMLGTNYLYLRAPPETPSVLDYLGTGPGYLPGLVALAVVVCLVCYAPFPIVRMVRRRP